MMKRLILIVATLLMLVPQIRAQKVTYQPADSIGLGSRVAHKSIQVGGGAVLTIGLTELLKSTVNEMRPDRSGTNSFPSRHSSWAFAGATLISNELYWHSPWWVLGSQAIATGVGFQRVMSERHYPGDVLAGAALGIGSMELGYLIGNLIYPECHRSYSGADNEQSASLSLSTGAVIPLNHRSGDVHFRTALATQLRLLMPLSESCAFQVSAILQSTPLVSHKYFVDMLNSFGLSLGAQYRRQFARTWDYEFEASLGAMKNLKVNCPGIAGFSFRSELSVGAFWRMTRSLSIGGIAGWQLSTYGRACSGLDLSFVTRANF